MRFIRYFEISKGRGAREVETNEHELKQDVEQFIGINAIIAFSPRTGRPQKYEQIGGAPPEESRRAEMNFNLN